MSLSERWRGLPRSMRWLVLAGAVVVGYLGVVDPMLAARQEANVSADRSAARLQEFARQSNRLQGAGAEIARGTSRFGAVGVPGRDSGTVSAASRKIREALTDRGIEEWNIQTQRASELPRVLEDLLEDESDELQRVTFNVTLTDEPEVVVAVLSEIERMPEVTTIGRLEIRRASGEEGRVTATLYPETWTIVRRGEGR